jgi:hypothetical protein
MGLVREIFDEVISLPKQADHNVIGENIMEATWRFPYTFLNAVFQIIDCVVIPYYTILAYFDGFESAILKWLILVPGLLASIFSIAQFLFYFISPTEKYINPIQGRILGETAVGALIASIFKIRIITNIK